MRRWACALLVAATPLLAGAQSLRGTVVDTTGRTVGYATLRLFADSSLRPPALATASTDASGNFSFDALPVGARYVAAFRVGFLPRLQSLPELHAAGDTIRIVMGEEERERVHRDSIRLARHRERVALARSRPRHWWCASSDTIARARARAAYASFGGGSQEGMGRVTVEAGMPSDHAGFMETFLRPLSPTECARFAAGFDLQSGGLETDTIEVYRFGRQFYLPWYGGYEGGFADADGKVLKVFIVPD